MPPASAAPPAPGPPAPSAAPALPATSAAAPASAAAPVPPQVSRQQTPPPSRDPAGASPVPAQTAGSASTVPLTDANAQERSCRGQAALLLCTCLKRTLPDITHGVASHTQQLCVLGVMPTLLASCVSCPLSTKPDGCSHWKTLLRPCPYTCQRIPASAALQGAPGQAGQPGAPVPRPAAPQAGAGAPLPPLPAVPGAAPAHHMQGEGAPAAPMAQGQMVSGPMGSGGMHGEGSPILGACVTHLLWCVLIVCMVWRCGGVGVHVANAAAPATCVPVIRQALCCKLSRTHVRPLWALPQLPALHMHATVMLHTSGAPLQA